MNLGQVNKWLTPVANLGLVLGIVLVAFQLERNTEATRVRIEYDHHEANRVGELASMGDAVSDAMTTAILKPSEMTQVQVYQVQCYLDVGLF